MKWTHISYTDWQADHVFDVLTDWQLIHWQTEILINWLTERNIDCLTDCVIDFLINWLTDKETNTPVLQIEKLTGWLTETDWLAHSLTESLTRWPTEWLIDPPTHTFTHWNQYIKTEQDVVFQWVFVFPGDNRKMFCLLNKVYTWHISYLVQCYQRECMFLKFCLMSMSNIKDQMALLARTLRHFQVKT